MKRILITFLLAVCLLLPLAGCTHSGAGVYKYTPDNVFGAQYDPGGTWAIYWYICGGDLESGHLRADGKGIDRYGAATDNINEMLSINLPENVTVVIEMGVTKNWWALDIDPEANSRYVFDSNCLRLIEKLPQAAKNDEKTVEGFLRFFNDNYPADHCGAIFWNHGGGSVNGVILISPKKPYFLAITIVIASEAIQSLKTSYIHASKFVVWIASSLRSSQ
jgi:hypothetical protein